MMIENTQAVSHRKSILCDFLCILMLLLLTPISSPNRADAEGYEGYKQYSVPKEFQDRATMNTIQRRKKEILKSSTIDGNARDLLKNYYMNYLFRAMTNESYASQIATLRLEFLGDFSESKGDVRKAILNSATLAPKLALNPELHPATRANAVLLWGELNVQEGAGPSAPPIPFRQITPWLLKEVQNPEQHEAVRSAGLVQLVRHVQLRSIAKGTNGISPEERDRIQAVALELLKAEEGPATRSPAAHEWFRTQAATILEYLKHPGADAVVAKSLQQVFAKENLGLPLKCRALQAYSSLEFGELKPDPTEVQYQTARLVIEILDAELLSMFKSMQSPDGRGNGGMPRGPFERGVEEDELSRRVKIEDRRTVPFRRRLLESLPRIRDSLAGNKIGRRGLSSVLGESTFQDSVAAIDQALMSLRNPKLEVSSLGRELEDVKAELEQKFPDKSRQRRDPRRQGERDEMAAFEP
jgi:hypothetical protein